MTKRCWSNWLWVAVWGASCVAPAEERASVFGGWPDARIDSLRSAVPALMTDHRVPGVAIVLTYRDSIQWADGFGVSGSDGAAVTPETVFQVASLGKPVFAHLLAKLEAEREWSLAEPIEQWSPNTGAPPEWLALSGEALLSHTSGLRYDPDTDQVSLDRSAQGEWSYSGAGYVLLQRALEATEDRRLDEIAYSELFAPYELASMTFVEPRAGVVAVGHDRSGSALQSSGWSAPNAGSSLHSNALDYARFIIRVAGMGAEAPPEWVRLTEGRAMVREDLGLSWGAGWALEREPVHGSVVAFHWGSNPGFKSFALVDRSRELGLVILTNGDHGLELVEQVVRILEGRSHPLFKFHMLHPDD